MRIYLQTPFTSERPPRFCMLSLQQDLLEGWTLIRETGYQGSSGQVKRENFGNQEAAEHALEIARDAQIKRGYRVMFASGRPPP
ncbi:WGR domain-containing protein [Gammaproteobacteria bacterium]